MLDLIQNIALVSSSGFVGAFSGWFFTRRKNTAEAKEKEAQAKHQEIDNSKEVVSMYRDFALEAKNGMQEVVAEMQAVKEDFRALKKFTNYMKNNCIQPGICQNYKKHG